MKQSEDETIKNEILNSAQETRGVIASGPAPEKKPNFFKTKNGKILLAVLGAVVVFGAGIGTALVLMNNNKSSETVANKSSDSENSGEKDKENAKTTAKSSSSEKVASTTETTGKSIDPSKPINAPSGASYTDIQEGNWNEWGSGWTVAITGNGTGATLTGDGAKLANYVFDWTGPGRTWQVAGFSGKIKSAVIGEFGQSFAPPMPAFYLMEDGTIEYNNILKWVSGSQGNVIDLNTTQEYGTDGRARGDDYFKVTGKVSGVSGVVKLYTAAVETGMTGGGRTTLAAKADGSFYDLGNSLGLYN